MNNHSFNQGSVRFACGVGYVLDPSIGDTYVCNNGQWSTKPRCQVTGRCSFSQLETFAASTVGIQTNNQSSLLLLPNEPGLVLNGSFILFSCISGYVNTGGSLNITCGNNGAWSPFPNCVQSSGSGPVTTIPPGAGPSSTTMMPTGGSGGTPCFVDRATIFNITNGYSTSGVLSYLSNTTATGNEKAYRPTIISYSM